MLTLPKSAQDHGGRHVLGRAPRFPVASARDLRVSYGGPTRALDGVSLDLFAGETVTLLGSSGAGKSTLLKSLTGFASIESGAVRLSGFDLTSLKRGQLRELRASTGQLFQQFNLIGRLSVLSSVLAGAPRRTDKVGLISGSSATDRRRAMEMLDRVGIAHKAEVPVRTLSGGQRQRVAIARTLMQQPRIILMDEPVASLDPQLSESVLKTLRSVAREESIPVLLSMGNPDLALRHSDRIVGLKHGEVVVSAPTAGLSRSALDEIYAHDAANDSLSQRRIS